MSSAEVIAGNLNRIVCVGDVLRDSIARIPQKAAELSSIADNPNVFPRIKRFFASLDMVRGMGLPIPEIPQEDFHPIVRRALNQSKKEGDFYLFERFAIAALNRLTCFEVRSSIIDVWINFASTVGRLQDTYLEGVVSKAYYEALERNAPDKELAFYEFALGKFLCAQGRMSEANDFLSGAVARPFASDEAETRLIMISLYAESFIARGEYDKAILQLSKAQQIAEAEETAPFVSDWRRAMVYEEIGMLCYQRGYVEKAADFLGACCHYLMKTPDADTAADLISASMFYGILLDAAHDYSSSHGFLAQAAQLDLQHHGNLDLCERILMRELERIETTDVPTEVCKAVLHVRNVVFKGLKRQLTQD